MRWSRTSSCGGRLRSSGGTAPCPGRQHPRPVRSWKARQDRHRHLRNLSEFFVPEVAYDDAERHIPDVLTKFGSSNETGAALAYLTQLRETVLPVPEEFYVVEKDEALARIEQRDPDDWPILALALVFECPIWTEDNDFFGAGVPTWTTDRVERYLSPKK